jgi:hypothetical protein
VLQANCRKSPDCTTTFLTKAMRRADVLLAQEFWADPRSDTGSWKVVQDPNFRFYFQREIKDPKKPPRALIAVANNPFVECETVCMERDMVAVWLGKGADRILVVNIYNPNPDPEAKGPLRSKQAIALLHLHRHWVIAGDFNA